MSTNKKTYSNLLMVEAIGHRTLKALSGSKKAAMVHSVFDHAFYIRAGGDVLINIIKNKNYISPTSILIRGFEDKPFRSLGIKEGMEIRFRDNSLIFGNNVLGIKVGRSSTWSSLPLPKQDAFVDLGINLRVLRDVIYTCSSREGLVPLLENVELYGPIQVFLHPQKPALSEMARPGIETLMWGLYMGDLNMVMNRASSLLGLGPGLTPSCDDFLTGLMLSLNIGGRALLKKRKNDLNFYRKVSSEISRTAKEKTTIHSQSFLNQARRGEGPKAVVELVHSLLTKSPDDVTVAAKTVINMGETSGADIAIGIYYGIRFLLSKLELQELGNIENLYGIA
ncbi:MAG TPA: DUF2877 domain-containing protein [Thermodesulfobacteriota bacterium]|nr:DUF2877 domain-containing protein [Thermodesulfobacteriota bacterium]